jgi:glycosyltransferase involved in cell wall biosynthesis
LKTIRVTFVEPSLAQYRVPFFRALAKCSDLRLQLRYAESGRVNSVPDGFKTSLAPRKTIRLLGHPVYWQQAQLDAVNPDDADVVSFDWDVHYASLVPALIRAKRRGVATILWGHGTSKNDGSWKAWPRQALARLADVIVTYAEPARQNLLAEGWPADRVFCAPNAIDQSLVQAAYAAVRKGHADERSAQLAARRELGLSADGPLLLFVSRLDPVRRVDVLIEALAQLASSRSTLALAIVGEGAAERERIERRAIDRGVRDRITFAGAEYDELRLARWYAAADVVVHPGWLGLSVYHAMGHGRPVVTGNDPGLHPPEAASVLDGVTGLRFDIDDPQACAAAIARLLNDDALRIRLGEAARTRAVTEHSIDTMAARFADAIRAAAARRGS